MKTNLIGLAVATALVTSFAASADDWDDNDQSQVQAPCEQDATSVGYDDGYENQPQGQYVAQNVQKWVPGRYDQVYVPFCPANRWGHLRCHGGRLESRWVPGYYTTVQQMVWVPDAAPQQQYGHQHHFHDGQARVGFQIGFH